MYDKLYANEWNWDWEQFFQLEKYTPHSCMWKCEFVCVFWAFCFEWCDINKWNWWKCSSFPAQCVSVIVEYQMHIKSSVSAHIHLQATQFNAKLLPTIYILLLAVMPFVRSFQLFLWHFACICWFENCFVTHSFLTTLDSTNIFHLLKNIEIRRNAEVDKNKRLQFFQHLPLKSKKNSLRLNISLPSFLLK